MSKPERYYIDADELEEEWDFPHVEIADRRPCKEKPVCDRCGNSTYDYIYVGGSSIKKAEITFKVTNCKCYYKERRDYWDRWQVRYRIKYGLLNPVRM